MDKKTLLELFTGRTFAIPEYQRDYAWTAQNIEELLGDIQEAIDTNTDHYIGTFILSRKAHGSSGPFMVVDGQQRLATLTMLLQALINEIGKFSSDDRLIETSQLIESKDEGRKLQLAGQNAAFFASLLSGKSISPQTRGQKLLREAYSNIQLRVGTIAQQHGAAVLRKWLKRIKALSVLEFIEHDEGQAIRIFQTVNDRGVQLTNMDKAKSLLVYYSNRFLQGELDAAVNEAFGQAFRDYDTIREISEDDRYPIGIFRQRAFNEDWILRWHYLASNHSTYDYQATTAYVLKGFLEPELKRKRDNREELRDFIAGYVGDLRSFFAALGRLLSPA